MSDTDSWMELCDLYLMEQDYSKAAFCIEELILSNPRNHLFHQKYAEVKQDIYYYYFMVRCSEKYTWNMTVTMFCINVMVILVIYGYNMTK